MPHFTLPISQDGLTVSVAVGIGPVGRTILQSSGQSLPTAIVTRGLLDQGSDITVVAPRLVTQLGLLAQGRASTQGTTGSAAVKLFEASLKLMGLSVPGAPVLELPQWIVMEAPHALPNLEVLIGLDVLRRCLLVSDGPGLHFTLAF